jgi:hypothetical protein
LECNIYIKTMNATKKSWIKKIVLIISVFVMIFSLSMPIALAQDDAQQENNTENTNINTQIDEKSENNVNQAVEACDEDTGGISIVVCPVVNLLMRGITRLTLGGGGQEEGQRKSPLISFLAVTPPRAVGDDGQPSRLAVVVNNVVTIANSIYILVFLILIFGSSLPFFTAQNYTIKKTLPKLIAAVILTQFTLVITGVIIDFFNLLGYAIPNVILALGQVPPDIVGSGGVTEKVGAGLGATITGAFAVGAGVSIVTAGFGWIFIIGFLIAAIISVIIGFVYMVLRYFLIYVMILIAPLAFVAWVIPGTEKFFKQWWTDFIRLNAMFVTIMALLSASIVIASALTGQEDTGLGFLPALMPIIALFLIPKTLKATTKGLSALSGAVLGAAGAATGKATGAIKSKGKEAAKGQFQETRNERAAAAFGKGNRRAAAIFQGKLPTSKGQMYAGQQAAQFEAEKLKNNKASLAQSSNLYQGLDLTQGRDKIKAQLEQRGLRGRALEHTTNTIFSSHQQAGGVAAGIESGNDLFNYELGQVAQGGTSALLGVSSGSEDLQVAAVSQLAQTGNYDVISNAQSAPGTKLTQDKVMKGIEPHIGDVSSKAPDLIKGKEGAFNSFSGGQLAGWDRDTVNRMLTHAQTQGRNSVAGKSLRAAVVEINNDSTKSIDPKVKAAINSSGLLGGTILK